MNSNLCNITVINTNSSDTFHLTGIPYSEILDENSDVDSDKIMNIFTEKFPNYTFKSSECDWGITNNVFIQSFDY